MAHLMKFDGQDGFPIYVNTEHVISVGGAKAHANGPLVLNAAAIMIGPVAIIVKGSPDTVARAINEAAKGLISTEKT